LQPDFEFIFVRPNLSHLRTRIALNHAGKEKGKCGMKKEKFSPDCLDGGETGSVRKRNRRITPTRSFPQSET
jgi:hypothetical protein